MRVLVTGGAGFVGSHVVDDLLDAGVTVRVVDVRERVHHRVDVEHVQGDLGDPEIARRAVEGVDAVSHQASMVGLGVDFADVDAYVRHNDLATAVLLGALHERRFAGRLVLASSMVVYGEGRYRCARHGVVRPEPRRPDDLEAGRWEPRCPDCDGGLVAEAVPEDAPVDPRNVYAATKLHQEHLAAAFGREHHGVVVTALRYHNVYGPRMPIDTPYAGVAALFTSALARGEPPRVFEDGGQRRDFVHVRDVARANTLALTRDPPCPGAVNVATGRPRTVLDMAEALARAFGPDAPPPQVVGGYRLGDVRHVFASAEQAAERLGFTAEIGFGVGMAELAASFRAAATSGPVRPGR